jgi:hypothetical protein
VPSYEIWDKQPNESARAYALFAHYRDMGPLERSFSRVSREFGRSVETVTGLSRKHNWVPRCTAWDAENERIKRASQIKAVESAARRQVLAGQMMMSKGLKRLQAMTDKEVDLLSVWESVRLIEGGSRLERIGLGEPEPGVFIGQSISLSLGETTLAEILRTNPTRVGPIVGLLAELAQTVPELSAGGAVYYDGEAEEIDPDFDLSDENEETT